MKWRVILEPDPDTNEWAIWCPELPGCTSAGIVKFCKKYMQMTANNC
ncbi:hypothetical protein MiAbB_04689 [Microcystis aeruginosa NIES-4285]|jgi:hypothetical protein|uniref:HicB-like antitoxin of toxin-antitoxin system domain-containing protein n=1 Tax=Microcystis aeruginosa NIES-4285 TaxID=2497681 RepID=A0A402DKP1_MICAE|nr:hypothetical protein MiAbB_04689 [Microcystis aeruginosa NIES-4285]